MIPKSSRRPGPRPAEAALRGRGLRLTRPRRLVLEVVRATDRHPTAEWVHRLVRRALPRVSLGTVYRNLRRLVDAGLLTEIPGPQARFDGNLEEHHHFTCTGCGAMLDLPADLVGAQGRALAGRLAAARGLAVTHHRLELYGRCAACRRRPARSRPGPRGRRPRAS
jgi:Fe2+ or Zn2+ uptake regulation protein